MTRAWTAAALLAALLLVLLGRIIPVPPLVTGEEGVRTHLVSTRLAAITSRYQFQQAELDYQHFLTTPLTNLPNELRQEADALDAGGDRPTILAAARERTQRMLALGNAMYPYALAGDDFYAKLRAYDDDLMSWSRTLGARSEQLRRSTWPILQWLQRYPEGMPEGINTELKFVPASQVTQTVQALVTLAPALDAPDANGATLRQLAATGDNLWVAGKYIPPVDSYHDGYFSALRRYDAQSLEVAATPEPSLASQQTILAWTGGVVLGGLLLGALLLIFAPSAFWRRFFPVLAAG